MLNKVILIGKICLDPELKYFKDESVITVIRLITKENIDGVEQNSWHRIIINNKVKILKKGMLIMVVGKIKTRRWLVRGVYNYITEVFAEEIKIISQGNENNWKTNISEEKNLEYENQDDDYISEEEKNIKNIEDVNKEDKGEYYDEEEED